MVTVLMCGGEVVLWSVAMCIFTYVCLPQRGRVYWVFAEERQGANQVREESKLSKCRAGDAAGRQCWM